MRLQADGGLAVGDDALPSSCLPHSERCCVQVLGSLPALKFLYMAFSSGAVTSLRWLSTLPALRDVCFTAPEPLLCFGPTVVRPCRPALWTELSFVT